MCGPGDAAGATAQGVTDDAIKVGTISDPGFVGRPGLNQELFDAAEVFAEWCNDAGGINGRKIEVDELDAKLTEYKQRITEACQRGLLPGRRRRRVRRHRPGRAAELPAARHPRLPGVAEARGSELAVAPLPTALDETPIARLPVPRGEVPGLHRGRRLHHRQRGLHRPRSTSRTRRPSRPLGWKVIYQAQYNSAGESSWTPFAQALKNEGVKGLVYTGEPENLAKLLQAIADIGYELDWVVVGANHLDQKFIDVGGAAVNNVFMHSLGRAVLRGRREPGHAAVPGPVRRSTCPTARARPCSASTPSRRGCSSPPAAKACGSEVTRTCVYEAAASHRRLDRRRPPRRDRPELGPGPALRHRVEATPDGFEVPDDFEPTDGLFRCDDDSVARARGRLRQGRHARGRRQEHGRPGVRRTDRPTT